MSKFRSNILSGGDRDRINRALRSYGYECVERLTDSEAERLLARARAEIRNTSRNTESSALRRAFS